MYIIYLICYIYSIYLICILYIYILHIYVRSKVYVIREYGSTLYVGMVRVVSFSLYIGIRAKIRNRLKIAEKKLCIVKNTPAML